MSLIGKAIQVIELIYDDGDFLFMNVRLMEYYTIQAEIYAKLGKTDEAIAAIGKAADHATAYDNLPDGDNSHASIAVNTREHNRLNVTTVCRTTLAEDLHKDLQTAAFAALRSDPRFMELCGRLK